MSPRPWARTDASEYLSCSLRSHDLLKDAPIHDVWRLDLPGGGPGRTIADVRALALQSRPGPVVRGLFAFRKALGGRLGWDRASTAGPEGLFLRRLSQRDRELSSVPTGTKDGPFTVLYVHPDEAVSEALNSTVHAALVWALRPRPEGGYRLLWAIHVKPVSWFTRFYLALIEPFRRWIVYPSLLRRLHDAWRQAYDSTADPEQ